jgi:hypothetical protein
LTICTDRSTPFRAAQLGGYGAKYRLATATLEAMQLFTEIDSLDDVRALHAPYLEPLFWPSQAALESAPRPTSVAPPVWA